MRITCGLAAAFLSPDGDLIGDRPLMSGKLFSHSVYWAAGPALFFLLATLAILSYNIQYYVLLAFIFLSFLVLPNFISFRVIKKYGKMKLANNFAVFFHLLSGSAQFYFLHGLSAYKALWLYVKRIVTGQDMKKGKTIMLNRD